MNANSNKIETRTPGGAQSERGTAIVERPILFSGEMVRAILDGEKTQTRRAVKKQPKDCGIIGCVDNWIWGRHHTGLQALLRLMEQESPYGQVGGRLWVKETFQDLRNESKQMPVAYRASWKDPEPPPQGWKPSIFMPRWASRITLEIVSIRVERLQEISEADILAEGVRVPYVKTDSGFSQLVRLTGNFRPSDYLTVKPKAATEAEWLRAHYASLWESINGKGAWEKNPWVWVIQFKQVNCRQDAGSTLKGGTIRA